MRQAYDYWQDQPGRPAFGIAAILRFLRKRFAPSKYGSGDPEAAFQRNFRQGTKSRQGALLSGPRDLSASPVRSSYSARLFSQIPRGGLTPRRSKCTAAEKYRGGAPYRTLAPWGLPTASPRKGLLCQSRYFLLCGVQAVRGRLGLVPRDGRTSHDLTR